LRSFPRTGGTFRAELEKQTYTLPGASTAKLSSGKHQITGSFSGPTFMIGFATVDEAGGVQTGSVRAVTGPSPQVRPCAITYSNTSSPETRRDFQIEFTVAADKSAAVRHSAAVAVETVTTTASRQSASATRCRTRDR
jgi:hypothetical protein